MMGKRDLLKDCYHAETGIEIDPRRDDWKQDAILLEKLNVKELDRELAEENDTLRSKMREAMAILEKGIADPYRKMRSLSEVGTSTGKTPPDEGRWLRSMLILSKKAEQVKRKGN